MFPLIGAIAARPWLAWGIPIAAGLAVGIGLSSAAKAEGASTMDLKGSAAIRPYLAAAERASGIGGLGAFGLAAAKRESGFSLGAENRSAGEAKAACRAWRRNREDFAGSSFDDEEHFCWGSGGWFGLLPGNAFASQTFAMMDPIAAIHDPAVTTAAWTAFVSRVVRNHLPRLPAEHRNWLSVRRAMASLATMYDFAEEHQRSKDVKARLAKDLRAVGVDPDFMFQRVSAPNWPGSAAVLAALEAVRDGGGAQA